MAPKGAQVPAQPSPQASTAVAAPASGGLAIPSFGAGGGVRGQERLTNADLKTPFLRLAQDKTQQVKDGLVKVGQFFNTLNNKVYGDSVVVIPILIGRGRMRFDDYNKGGGILGSSQDAIKADLLCGETDEHKQTSDCLSCRYARWTEDGKGGKNPPECNEQGNYLVLVPGEEVPLKLVLQRTGFKTHRKVATLLAAVKADVFLQKIRLKVGNSGETLFIDAEHAGMLQESEEPLYRQCEEIYKRMEKIFFTAPMGGETQLASDI